MGGFTDRASGSAVKTIEVLKGRLVERLQENLENHKKNFKEAWAGYLDARSVAISRIGEVATNADSNNRKDRKKLNEVYTLFQNLDVPQDHSKDYEQALGLMEWEVSDKLELSIQDFEYFINDNWNWTGKFRRTMSSYT